MTRQGKQANPELVLTEEEDPEIDIVLYICALAFRRNIADFENSNAWYNSTQALVRFRADAKDRPVLILSSIDETHEGNIPWAPKSATAVDLSDPLLSPNTFRIKDIRRYALTDEELETGIDQREDVLRLDEQLRGYLTEKKNRLYGSNKQNKWSSNEKKQLEILQTQLKRQKKLLKIQLTPAKFLHLNTLLEDNLKLDFNNKLVLDEVSLKIPKRPVEADDNDETDEDLEEKADEGNEEDEDDIESEILYEEDQAADYANSTLNSEIPIADTVLTAEDDLRLIDIQALINLQPIVPAKKKL
ncbi:hypothetical protein BDF21DRAFT_468978 [Thamnidium elegans]|nr:hypothetical protein BDF21DRAFT_468978 [Thamnidium elegans]